MKSSFKILFNMSKASQREKAKDAGFYDGRFRTRKVISKKYKNPKHKDKLFNNE